MQILLIFLITLICSNNTYAQWDLTADVKHESRIFEQDNLDQTVDHTYSISMGLQFELKYSDLLLKLSIVNQINNSANDSYYLFLEDNFIEYDIDNITLSGGTKIFNWSATEFFHPADVVNSKNFNSRIDKFEKLGQSFISLKYLLGDGDITLFLFPYLTLPTILGSKSRFKVVTQTESGSWTDHSGVLSTSKALPMPALRFTQSIGDIDLSFHIIKHVDRETPLMVVDPSTGSLSSLYLMVTQVGFTYQQLLPLDIILKIEHASKFYKNSTYLDSLLANREIANYHTSVVSLEYGFSHDQGTDSTFFLESQLITGVGQDYRASLSLFQKDIMVGYRFAFNDVEAKEIITNVIIDLERSGEYLFNLNYKQRISNSWQFDVGIFLFFAPENSVTPQGLELLNNADHVYTTLTKYF